MKLQPNFELQNPNVCTICEERPDGQVVVDTERYTPFNVTYPLNGRKYLCERCATEIAHLLNYVSSTSVEQAQVQVENARTELANVKSRVVELADHIKSFLVTPAATDATWSELAVEDIKNEVTPASSALNVAADAPQPSYEELFGDPEAEFTEPKRKPGRPKKSDSTIGSSTDAPQAE